MAIVFGSRVHRLGCTGPIACCLAVACGNGTEAQKPDTATADDDAAVAVCSSVDPEIPDWSVEVAYDLPALGPERDGRSRGVAGVFVDDGDVLLFGDNNFARLRTDGAIVSTVPYPAQSGNDEPVVLESVARGSTTFAGLILPNARFCVFDAAGSIDLDACVDAPHPSATRTVFADGTFWNQLGGSNPSLWPVSEKGVGGAAQTLGIGDISSFDILGTTALLGIRTSGADCTVQVSSVVLGDGSAGTPNTVLPAACASVRSVEVTSGKDAALVVYQGGHRNADVPLECGALQPYGSFGVVVGSDGQPSVQRSYGSLLLGDNSLYWDPPYFLVLNDIDTALRLYWVDPTGVLVGRADVLDLGSSGNTDGRSAVAVLDTNEYVVGYGVVGAGDGTRIRRIRVMGVPR